MATWTHMSHAWVAQHAHFNAAVHSVKRGHQDHLSHFTGYLSATGATRAPYRTL